MEVLGDLIRLDPTGQLPLPWSVRAHLGLETNTGVSVFLTEPGGGRISDILVTPLTPNKLGSTYSVEISVPEGMGAVKGVLSRVGRDVNVVISDTLTKEVRKKHTLNLVVEPARDDVGPQDFKRFLAKRLKVLGVRTGDIKPVYGSARLIPQPPLRIQNAFLPAFNWREDIAAKFPNIVGRYDLRKVVVSSNPDQRILRYIFPVRGVVQLDIPHYNLPGALSAITEEIADKHYNILSSRLSRTPRHPMNELMSVFVAVCEPEEPRDPDNKVDADKLCAAIKGVDKKYITIRAKHSFGRRASATRYSLPRDAQIVLPPERLLQQIQEEKRRAVRKFSAENENKRPKKLIFVSYRFVDNRPQTKPDVVKEHAASLAVIKKAINDAKCHYSTLPAPWERDTTAEAIFPALWAADACIVFAFNEEGVGLPSLSQAHEYGFFMGQRKPARMVVKHSDIGATAPLGNADGFIRLTYSLSENSKKLDPNDETEEGHAVKDAEPLYSLYQQVRRFIEGICEDPEEEPDELPHASLAAPPSVKVDTTLRRWKRAAKKTARPAKKTKARKSAKRSSPKAARRRRRAAP
jgi:hypothetical protein